MITSYHPFVTAPCTALPTARLIPYVIREGVEFPLSSGSEIQLSCYEGFELEGDRKMTCYSGTYFTYAGDSGELPKCTPTLSSGMPGGSDDRQCENLSFSLNV